MGRTVEDALNCCPRVLVVLSPGSVKSDNVRDEVSFALSKQKRLIPVLYRECDIPFRLARLQQIDFRSDYARGLKAVIKALGMEQSPPVALAPPEVPRENQPVVLNAEERKQVAARARLEEENRRAAEPERLEQEHRQLEEQVELQQQSNKPVGSILRRILWLRKNWKRSLPAGLAIILLSILGLALYLLRASAHLTSVTFVTPQSGWGSRK